MSFSNTMVVALVPMSIDSAPGTYLLKMVKNGHSEDDDTVSTSAFDVAIGAVGVQGAKGDTGAQGPAGATGAQGATGATGATSPSNGYRTGNNGINVSLGTDQSNPTTVLSLSLPSGLYMVFAKAYVTGGNSVSCWLVNSNGGVIDNALATNAMVTLIGGAAIETSSATLKCFGFSPGGVAALSSLAAIQVGALSIH